MPLCLPNTKNESRSSSLSKSAMCRQLKRLQQRNDIFSSKLDDLQSRFMNLGPLFKWATMVLFHLNTPGSDA